MKKILLLILFLFALSISVKAACVTPVENATYNASPMVLCGGVISDNYGFTIANSSGFILDCNGTTLMGSNITNTYGVNLNNGNVVVKNCIFDGQYRGIRALQRDNLNFTNNTFRNNYYGIYTSPTVKRMNYSFTYNTIYGFMNGSANGAGIYLDGRNYSNVDIRGNSFNGSWNSIDMFSGINISGLTIQDNNFQSSLNFHIYTKDIADGTIIRNNNFNNGGWNCIDLNSDYANITGNNFTNCLHHSIDLRENNDNYNVKAANYAIIDGNRINNSGTDSDIGQIYVNMGHDNIVKNNVLWNAHITVEGNYTVTYNNQVINNSFYNGNESLRIEANNTLVENNTIYSRRSSYYDFTFASFSHSVGIQLISTFKNNNVVGDGMNYAVFSWDNMQANIYPGAYPYNDLYNISNGVLLASNGENISAGGINNQLITAGDYTCAKHYQDSGISYSCNATSCYFTNTNCTFKTGRTS